MVNPNWILRIPHSPSNEHFVGLKRTKAYTRVDDYVHVGQPETKICWRLAGLTGLDVWEIFRGVVVPVASGDRTGIIGLISATSQLMKVTIMVFTFMPMYTYYLAQLNLQAVEIICDERCDQDRVEETMTGSASECPGTGGGWASFSHFHLCHDQQMLYIPMKGDDHQSVKHN